MTWDAFHDREDVLRAVVDEADRRRDGVPPTWLPGVAEAFGDELGLVAALQLRWHTRLAGRIERALDDHPDDPRTAVLAAWRDTATELVGVRQILDAEARTPRTPEVGATLARAHRKDAALMAAMAGAADPSSPSAVRRGERLEAEARATYQPASSPRHRAPDPSSGPGTDGGRAGLLARIRGHLAAV